MRSPLAPAGLREILILTAVFGGTAAWAFYMVAAGYAWAWPIAILFMIVWLSGLAFFRDPERQIPPGAEIMVAPADGKIVETALLDQHPQIGGPATRISIFLSVFDVHINRSPCAGTVRSVDYTPGRFLDARDPNSGTINEANTVVIELDDPSAGPVVVRQIAGLIARRIVCSVRPGDRVETGQRIGLIKFGSRTELILPGKDLYQPTVAVGDKARGAVTIVARRMTPAEAEELAAQSSVHEIRPAGERQ
ncbi:MAG: phosphatidylserine decarboxylase proenzyme [Phycisphaerae bacterium]